MLAFSEEMVKNSEDIEETRGHLIQAMLASSFQKRNDDKIPQFQTYLTIFRGFPCFSVSPESLFWSLSANSQRSRGKHMW